MRLVNFNNQPIKLTEDDEVDPIFYTERSKILAGYRSKK